MKRYIILSLLLSGLASCYKDKGNYTYHPLKQITIDSLVNLKRFYMDSLVINPGVAVDKGTESELDFQWSMFPTTQSMEALPAQPEIISRSKVLRIRLEKAVRQYPYVVILRVTDKATGVSTYRRFELMISSPFASGWLVLSDRNNISDVDIITREDSVISRIYELVNGTAIKGKGTRLRLLGAYSGADELFIQTEDNLLQVRNPEFNLLQDAAAMFYTKPDRVSPQYLAINDYGTQRYLVNSGKVFGASTLNNGKYGLPYIGDYEAAPFIAGGSYSAVYDKKNGRFLKIPVLSNSVTMEAFTELKPDPAFDVNNIKGDLMYMEQGPDLSYHFFREAGGNIRLYGLNTYSNDAPGAFTQQVAATELKQATAFAISGTLPLTYFAAGNSLYLYDIGANQARKLYDFPAGSTVPVIRMLKDWNSDDDNSFLAVGVNSGSNGTVYYFKLAGTGELAGNTYKKQFNGFGRIADIIYKNK